MERGEEQGAENSNFGFRIADLARAKDRHQFRIADCEFRAAPSSVDSDWHSNSDTEVILRAYARWGRECVNHLRGMFAFAIWDEQEQELFLARDPFGIKPLYYYQTDHFFLFASEIRALLSSGLVPRKLSLGRCGLLSSIRFRPGSINHHRRSAISTPRPFPHGKVQ